MRRQCPETCITDEQISEWRRLNKKRCDREYRLKYLAEFKEKDRIERLKPGNREKRKIYMDLHKEEFGKINNEWRKRKKQEDPAYRVLCNLRSRLAKCLKRHQISKETQNILGVKSAEQFWQHLESQWAFGMNWDNYGLKSGHTPFWEIDHIKNCKQFNLLDPKQVKLCFNYTNLQPLWRHENSDKRFVEFAQTL